MDRTTALRILQLEPSATADDIRRKYLRLSKIAHPDKRTGKLSGTQCADFVDINAAYETLTRPQYQSQYTDDNWVDKLLYSQELRALEHGWKRASGKSKGMI